MGLRTLINRHHGLVSEALHTHLAQLDPISSRPGALKLTFGCGEPFNDRLMGINWDGMRSVTCSGCKAWYAAHPDYPCIAIIDRKAL